MGMAFSHRMRRVRTPTKQTTVTETTAPVGTYPRGASAYVRWTCGQTCGEATLVGWNQLGDRACDQRVTDTGLLDRRERLSAWRAAPSDLRLGHDPPDQCASGPERQSRRHPSRSTELAHRRMKWTLGTGHEIPNPCQGSLPLETTTREKPECQGLPMTNRWNDTRIRTREVLSVLSLGGLLWACAGPKAVASPDWVMSQPFSYPTTHYLVGVGSAPTRGGIPEALEAASASARAQIGQTIEVRVEHVGEFLQEMTSEGEGRGGQLNWALETERSSLGSFTRTSTSQMVRGIELKEKYLDERMDILYVLAVLDKAQAARRLGTDAAELRSEAVLLRSRARTFEIDGEILAAIHTLRLALKTSLEADLLRKQLSVVAPHETFPVEREASSATLATSLAVLLGELELYVAVDGPQLVVDAIYEALGRTELWARAGSPPDSTGLTLWGQMTEKWDNFSALDGPGDTLRVCRVYLGLKVLENRTGKIAGQVNLVANSNARDSLQAKERAVRQLRRRVIEELPSSVYRVLSIGEE